MSLKDWMKRVEGAQLSENITPQTATTKPGMNSTAAQQTAQNTNSLSQGLSKVGITQNTAGVAKALSSPPGVNSPSTDKTIAGVAKNIGLDKLLADPTSASKLAPMVKNLAAQNAQQNGQQNQPGLQEEEVSEVAPPGMEKTVLALKKKFPGNPQRAFATAWSMYNKKHGKTEESMMESKQLNEGTLEEIIGNHPHEHKMCQEGWGMDNSLFEALADHYYKEGRIPRSVWHGSAEELREFVESCYAKDTMGSNEGAINSGMLDEEGVAEGYHDLNDDGMQPIDFSTSPSIKSLMNRHSQLYYQGMEDTTTDEEMAEQDAIEAYTLKNFGQKGLDHLNKATQTNFWGRNDKPFGRDSRSSNLGRPSQPTGDFRTTKSGVMHKQDAKIMKGKIADRLGSHPDPMLPEGSKEDFTMNARQADPRLDKYATDPKPSFLDRAGSAVGGAMKSAANKVINTFGGPDDEELKTRPLRALDEETSELERMLRQSTKESAMYESKSKKISENTGVTDYNPKSQGGTRKELLAKYAKSGSSADATAARKAGATQDELKAAKAKCDAKKVSEAVEKTKTGIRHKADAGGYGRVDDEEDTDEDGKKIKKVAKDEPKKGRGRPKKTDNASGEDKKFDFSALSKTSGSKAPKTDKWDKKKTTTHKIATKADREEIDEGRDVMEDDAGDVEQRMLAKIEKEKQRLAKLKQTDPEAYKREMEKRKTSSRIPPVSTFEGRGVSEGETIEKKGGRIHKGSYGTSHEAGDEGVKKVVTQRGRGRPKKDADDSGEVKNYDFSAFGVKKGTKLPAWDKKKTTTHKIATKADREEVDEAKLKGKQSKLDINKNGKLDGGDFAMLRGKKKKDPQMESWDRQLKGLLTEGRQLNEGLTVSTSVGNQGGQDTVSITASDTDAHQLLQMLQNAGMGSGVPHHAVQAATAPAQVLPKTSPSSTASIATTDGAPNAGAQKDIDGAGNSVPIMAMPRGMAFSVNDETEMPTEPGEFGTLDQEEVVSALGSEQGSADDSGDSALAAIKKLMGQHGASEVTAKEFTPPESKAPAAETEVEESDTDGKKPDFLDLDKDGDKKEPMKQASKKDDSDEESEEEDDEEDKEVKEGFDFADATANEIEKHKKHEKVEEGAQTCNECGGLMEDDHQCGQLNEWANSPEGQSDDEQFKTDMAFMTKVLSGGLNGQKSTGQATTPILASQTNRQMSEGYNIDVAAEMRKLAGIR